MLYGINSMNAQGTWTGESATSFVYDFGTQTKSFAATSTVQSSVSTSSVAAFMPVQTSGLSRLYTNTKGGGFELTPDFIKLTAATEASNNNNKFSVYNITETSSVSSIFFKINFNQTTANAGVIIFALGNSSSITENSNVFNNADLAASSSITGIFNYLRWDVGTTAITANYRGTDFSPAAINASTFTKSNTDYNIELYCNNFSSAQTYSKGGTTYNLPSKTFNIWVNGTLLSRTISGSVVTNFPATNELTTGLPINSFSVTGSRNTSGGPLTVTVSDISIKHVSQNTLPVSLSSFSANKNRQTAILNWETTSEQSNAYFDIMRSSSEGEQFEKIGRVAGNGNSQKVINYSFTDFNPLAGTNYYLLKQFDTDGKSTNSEIKAVTIAEDSKFQASAIEGKLYVKLSSEIKENGKITITDITGKRIIEEKLLLNKGNNNFNYDISGIQHGVYIATVSSGSIKKSLKFFK